VSVLLGVGSIGAAASPAKREATGARPAKKNLVSQVKA
jgi:hypothetical protein